MPTFTSSYRTGEGNKISQTIMMNKLATSNRMRASHHTTGGRNLEKIQLGGVIFGCKESTIKECLFKQLFGLPSHHFWYVKKISPGLPLFLFNYSDRSLHGIFEAASCGQMNINPYAWTIDGSETTPYPAQVQVRVRLQCQALPENQFKPIIMDNYFSQNHFWFELDHAQTNKLISLQSSLAIVPRTYTPKNTIKWRTLFQGAPSSTKRDDNHISYPALKVDGSHPYTTLNGKSGISDAVLCSVGNNRPSEDSLYTVEKKEDDHEKDFIYLKLKELVFRREGRKSTFAGCEDHSPHVNDMNMAKSGFLKQVATFEENNGNIPLNSSRDTAFVNARNLEINCLSRKVARHEENNETISTNLSECPNVTVQLIQEVEDLIALKMEQNQKISYLEQKLVEAETEIQLLKDHCKTLESLENRLVKCDDVTTTESPCAICLLNDSCMTSESALKPHLKSNHATATESPCKTLQLQDECLESLGEIEHLKDKSMILESLVNHEVECDGITTTESPGHVHLDSGGMVILFGGYDGVSLLSLLDSSSPTEDLIKPVKLMNNTHPYASVTKLNRRFYVFGGRTGSVWYETVESCDPIRDEWSFCLSKKEDNVADSNIIGKIFAVGDGNDSDFVSAVEMVNLEIRSWVLTQSMLEKRFALAAVALNGALYGVGGYDGNDNLKFDLREPSWTRIVSMRTQTSGHSIAVLKEKIHVLGGCDCKEMDRSIEIYDHRLDSWMIGEIMNQPRGYSAAAVLKESIYFISRPKTDEESLDKVECYKEGHPWERTNLKAIGTRCSASVIAL